MPTREQVRDATPRCPGRKLSAGNWRECGRLLQWKHEHEMWACKLHGHVETGITATELKTAA